MAYLRHIFLTFSHLFVLVLAQAQQSNSLYFLKDAAQWSLINPAYISENEFIIGVPVLSGFTAGFNNDFSMGSIISKGHGILADTLSFDFNSFSQSIKNQNKYSFEAGILMFYAGYKSGKNYYSVELSEKSYFRGTFDKSFVEYFEKGIASYYGFDSNLGGLSFDVGQYREAGFGFSRQPNKKITYGLRMKILFGRLNLASDGVEFNIQSKAGEDLYLGSSGLVNIAGPLTYATDTTEGTVKARRDLQASDYYFNLSNIGMGMDAGIVYRTGKTFSFSASVNYSGIIKYSKKHFSLVATNDLEYNSDSLLNASNYSEPRYLKGNEALYSFRDSIPYIVEVIPGDNPQWEYLPTTIYLGADYQINQKISAGFIQKIFISKGFSSYVTTLGITSEVKKGLVVTGCYSIMPKNYFNIGFGAAYQVSAAQFVFSTDNILTLVSPNNAKNLNLQFGINLLIDKN